MPPHSLLSPKPSFSWLIQLATYYWNNLIQRNSCYVYHGQNVWRIAWQGHRWYCPMINEINVFWGCYLVCMGWLVVGRCEYMASSEWMVGCMNELVNTQSNEERAIGIWYLQKKQQIYVCISNRSKEVSCYFYCSHMKTRLFGCWW